LLALGREFAGSSLLEDVRATMTGQEGASADDLLSRSVQADPRLPALSRRISGAGRKFNVILIVLESVGAGQLLEDNGLPSPLAAPHLRKLARNAVIFDHVYVCFPGSVRSLVNLHTGGFDVSWAGIFETRYKFNGPTIAGSFADAGYRTALFSSERLDGESADIFLMQTGFQDFYDFSLHKGSLKQEEYIHSWGSVESVTLREMFQWIDRNRDSKRPFLINYMNAATHHPYGVPEGYPALFQSPNRKGRYLSSIHYTDSGIGEIVAFLKSRGLYENTILAVTGDHGQAFGEYHPRNFLHKNEVYEENVRSFLYLSNPRLTEAPVVSSRIGSMGGILPTLLDLTGIPVSPETPSRSLWPEQFPDKPVFFHELARPEKWGLRDGRWKFASTIRSGEHELYDLTADKQEQRNLAAMHRQRTEFYSALCRRWYLDSGAKFTSRLAGYRATQAPLRSWLIDPPPPGPLLLQVGTSQPGSGAIIAKERFGKDETPVAWIQWSLCKAPEPAVIEWLAPSGQTFKSEIFCPIAMVHEVVSFPGGKMNSGGWTLRLHFRNRPSLTTSFHVEAGTKVP
jgi:arylsulfatase A-like enzyme